MRCASATRTGPKLFARQIVLPSMLYERVIEIDERIDAHGQVLTPLDEDAARRGLEDAWSAGIRAVAIVLMHGYRFTDHERRTAEIARGRRLRADLGQPRGEPADEAGLARRHHRRRRLPVAHPPPLRRRRRRAIWAMSG